MSKFSHGLVSQVLNEISSIHKLKNVVTSERKNTDLRGSLTMR